MHGIASGRDWTPMANSATVTNVHDIKSLNYWLCLQTEKQAADVRSCKALIQQLIYLSALARTYTWQKINGSIWA